jgi:Rieske Fe-S protein
MSDNDADLENAPEERRPHRVIGTPPPAAGLLTDTGRGDGEDESPVEEPWIPADNPDPVSAKNWERVAALVFILSALASVGFIAAYVGLEIGTKNGDVVDATLRSNLALGTAMSVAFLAIGIGMVIWVRYIMPPAEVTEERHPLASSPEDRAAFAETFIEGAETSQITKRPLLRRTLLTALLGFQDNDEVLAKATVIIIKMEPGQLKAPTNLNWTVDNIVAYSKICTHVGCPAALYEQTTHKILCPCHQSTFDATRGATVLFGPAPRPLPQLPITVDAQGYLVAQSDFHEPIGPSFWERG